MSEPTLKHYALCAVLFYAFLVWIAVMDSPAPVPSDEELGNSTTSNNFRSY